MLKKSGKRAVCMNLRSALLTAKEWKLGAIR